MLKKEALGDLTASKATQQKGRKLSLSARPEFGVCFQHLARYFEPLSLRV